MIAQYDRFKPIQRVLLPRDRGKSARLVVQFILQGRPYSLVVG